MRSNLKIIARRHSFLLLMALVPIFFIGAVVVMNPAAAQCTTICPDEVCGPLTMVEKGCTYTNYGTRFICLIKTLEGECFEVRAHTADACCSGYFETECTLQKLCKQNCVCEVTGVRIDRCCDFAYNCYTKDLDYYTTKVTCP